MSVSPDDLFEWVGDPVEGPMPFLMITDGWIESSEALARVHETIVQQADLRTVAEFSTNELIDQRARRPVVSLIDGVIQGLAWPELLLSVGSDANDRPFLYLHGPEPDFNWRPFARTVSTILQTIGITTMYTLGAYPVPAPHTRDVRISHAATSSDLFGTGDTTNGSIKVPVGVQMAVTVELFESGIGTLGMYAQVPYYIATTAWPQASVGLLTALQNSSGLSFDLSVLERQIPDAVAAVESTLEDAPSLRDIVAELEQRFDDLSRIEAADLPSGDELEQQLQDYLRDLDET